MLDLSLFLGVVSEKGLQRELQKANPYLVASMLGKQDYLQHISHKDEIYLGKAVQGHPTIEQLEDLEKHVLSLLQKLTPHYPFSKNPPRLITLSSSAACSVHGK